MDTKSLREFIRDKGVDRAALIFGVKPRTVTSWFYGSRHPRVRDIPALIARSGGELTLESFFEERAA